MTIHVNIGEAKTRLSELIAAAVAGEEVILDKAGEPQVRLQVVEELARRRGEELAEKRRRAFEENAMKYAHLQGSDATIVPPSMTDEEYEERIRRKFGPPAAS